MCSDLGHRQRSTVVVNAGAGKCPGQQYRRFSLCRQARFLLRRRRHRSPLEQILPEGQPVVHAAITLAFNAAGTLFVTGDRFGNLVLSNAVTGEQIKQIKAGTGEIEHLCFGSDETTLIVSGEDGVQLRDFPSLDLRATFFFSHDRSLTILADNFYAASRGIFDFVSFRLDNRVYAVDQFDLLYNRPDKVLTALGNKDEALIAAYSALHDRRIAQMSQGAEPAKPTSIPDLVISQRLLPSTQNRALDISFKASDKSSAIQSVAVVDNGVPCSEASERLPGLWERLLIPLLQRCRWSPG